MLEFIIYAIIFRLAVIVSGLACIYMGYRLFILGVMPGSGNASEIGAEAGAVKLTVKNAAPGTCFAAFGALLVVVMLIQGMPALQRTESAVSADASQTSEIVMRSGDKGAVAAAMDSGRMLQRDGDRDGAIGAYASVFGHPELRLGDIVGPLRAIVAIYNEQERYDEAIAFITLANQIDPENPAGFALYARAEAGRGDTAAAVEAMKAAVEIDPSLKSELEEMRFQK